MSEERDDLSTANNGNGGGQQAAQKGAQAVQKGAEAAKKAADAAKKAKQAAQAAKAAGSASKIAALAGTPVGWVILAVIVIVVILIIFIGVYAYVVGAWGSITEKIKQWGTSAWTSFKGAVIGQAEAAVTTDQIIEVANYIEEMGYDVQGSGLVTGKLLRESDVTYTDELDDDGNKVYTIKDHSGEPDYKPTGKIVYVDSLYLKTYLISDNLSYLMRNFNQPFAGVLKGIVGAIGDVFDYLATGEYYYRTRAIGSGGDGVLSSIGEGLITLYKFDISDGSLTVYGSDKDKWNELIQNLRWGNSGDEIKIDKDSKTLTLKRGFGNASFTFKLDGWTGRYGMPLEFLLSVHMATMAPDLTYTMATSFDTQVKLALRPLDNQQIVGAINVPSVGWVTTSEFGKVFENNAVSAWWGELTGTINVAPDELEKLLNEWYGSSEIVFKDIEDEDDKDLENYLPQEFKDYISAAGYNPEKFNYENEDGKDKGLKNFFVDAFLTLRQAIEDKDFSTYVPFLYEVSDHWYRDVYWVMDSTRYNEVVEDGGFVAIDQQYLKDTEERWTLYEYETVKYTNPDTGEEYTEKVYVVNDDGTKKVDYYANVEEEYEGVVGSDGEITTTVDTENTSAESQLKDDDNKGFDNLVGDLRWSAYEFDKGGVQSQYEPVNLDSCDDSYAAGFKELEEDYLFAKGDFAGSVVQREDALRGPTNPKIKEIFRDKYYIYDGTVETAEAIEKDKIESVAAAVNDIAQAMEDTLNKAVDAMFLGKFLAAIGIIPSFDVEAIVNDEGLLEIGINGGPKATIALGLSKWISKFIPDEYRDAGLYKQVQLNKDALTAFAILENTETLDADYIYKDFKELLVELDYFDKEELRETIVPTFQWLYEETGSAGWPVRKWEKDALEYGTLIHSKVNLDYLKDKEYEEAEKNGSQIQSSSNPSKVPTKKVQNKVSVEEFLEAAEKIHQGMEDPSKGGGGEYYAGQTFWYCIYGREKEKHPGPCGLTMDFERAYENEDLNRTCCATYVSWVIIEAGLNIDSSGAEIACSHGAKETYNIFSEYFAEVSSYDDLEAGDIIFQTQGKTGCEGQIDQIGHVQICADVNSWYNAGGNSSIQKPNPYDGENYQRSTFVIGLRPNGRDQITPFEGFEKDDLVASPVTGRIIRIGTIGEENFLYKAPNDNRELDIVEIENENPDNEYVEGLNYIEIEVLNMEKPETMLSSFGEDTKKGYQLFLEDYVAQNCNGYVVRIEGYVHELSTSSLQTAESIFIPPEASEYLRNKEQKKKEIEYLENALPGFTLGGECYIKEGTVLGKTTDCNMKISMFDLEQSIVENIEDYIEIDDEEAYPRQPYVAQPGDLELLANLMHFENCYNALTTTYGLTDVEGIAGNKGTGYVAINRALVDYGNHGTTLVDQISAPNQYATWDKIKDMTEAVCSTCLEAAEWCLTWDCMSIINQSGEQMKRNVLTQSGWCACDEQNGSLPGEKCWLYIDTVEKGTVNEHTTARPKIFDEFYCELKQYEGYP